MIFVYLVLPQLASHLRRPARRPRQFVGHRSGLRFGQCAVTLGDRAV